jgi:hypothetical protein
MRRIAPLLAILLMSCTQSHAQATTAQDPVAGIVKLFDTYRIVMLGEIHGSTQEWELLEKLVAAPGFAGRVNDIVMEAGNSFYQDVVDRYIAGEGVSADQIQHAWRDTVGFLGPVSPLYGDFYAAVRTVNHKLPKERRLRVLLADPPIDWARVRSREDIAFFLPFRDEFYASVVRYQVLAKGHRALLIEGAGHFERRAGRPGFTENELLTAWVQPYVIIPGSNMVGGYDNLDPRFDGLPAPALVETKGTWIGSLAAQPGQNGAPPATWEHTADAYLYLGPRDTLTLTFPPRSALDGTPYGKEMQRRMSILFDKPPDIVASATETGVRPAFTRIAAAAPPLPPLGKPRP